MLVTESKLRQIIKEEYVALLKEADGSERAIQGAPSPKLAFIKKHSMRGLEPTQSAPGPQSRDTGTIQDISNQLQFFHSLESSKDEFSDGVKNAILAVYKELVDKKRKEQVDKYLNDKKLLRIKDVIGQN